jgi:DNA (cytosine-5)-methyltransferase 1
MVHLDLFSGIGGFALACQWAGIETIGFVEIDKYCQKVLRKHWPDVPIMEDIRDVKEDTFQRPIDLITGGFPCQPFSVAGRREGERDDRYLWPEMLRTIETYRPSWVLGENVAGIIDMALDTVLSDLERISYATQTFIIPACAIGASHRRDRVWIIAYTNSIGLSRTETTRDRLSGFEMLGFSQSNCVTSESLRAVNGISTELDSDRLKALGNAIVPQMAYEIIRVIKEVTNGE